MIEFEKHQRQGPQLLQVKYAQVLAASQEDQGSELKETAESRNGACDEAEERRKQRDAPVHRPKQVIEESRHSDIERKIDEASGETQPE